MGAGKGMSGAGKSSQVFYDPASGQYFTYGYTGDFNNFKKYINAPSSSKISNIVQEAMNAQANPVSMDQLFPYMNYGATNTTGANMGGIGGLSGLLGMTGSSGAGRFLSAPTSTTM